MNSLLKKENPFFPYELKISETERKKMIGASLKKYREKKGYKQKEIADLLNITQSSYSTYETGKNEPSIETLVRLSYLYDVPVDNLIQREALYPSIDDAIKDYEKLKKSLTEIKEAFPKSELKENKMLKTMLKFMEEMEMALDDEAEKISEQ